MAETILLMDRSLSSTVSKYKKEKSVVSEKAASSLDYVNTAARKLDLNDTVMSSVDQTLQVVNQGIEHNFERFYHPIVIVIKNGKTINFTTRDSGIIGHLIFLNIVVL